MSMIAGFEHDVFISYAHTNDKDAAAKLDNEERSWVEAFSELFRRKLRSCLGGIEPSIWRDATNALRGEKFYPLIKSGIENSAVCVALVSRAYLRREWCQKEVRWFHAQKSPSSVNNPDRFVVATLECGLSLDEISQLATPSGMDPEMFSSSPFEFFYLGKDGGSHRERDSRRFDETLDALAAHVARVLLRMAEVPPDWRRLIDRAATRNVGRKCVFIATPLGHNSQTAQGGWIHSALVQEKINVIDLNTLRVPEESLQVCIEHSLARANLCLHIIPDRSQLGEVERYVDMSRLMIALSEEEALRRAPEDGFVSLYWICRGEVGDESRAIDVKYEEFLEEVAKLPSSSTEVLDCSEREVFKQLLRYLKSDRSEGSQGELEQQKQALAECSIYIAHMKEDARFVAGLRECLKELGIRKFYNPARPDQREGGIRSYMNLHRATLRICDGLIVLYPRDDNVVLSWVVVPTVILEGQKKLSKLKHRIIYQPPPQMADTLPFDDPTWPVVRAQHPVDTEQLRLFCRSLLQA